MKPIYISINTYIKKHPFLKGSIHFISRFCPYMVIIFYFLFLLKIYIEWESQLFFFIKKPVYSFIIVTALKFLFNRERPSQKYNFTTIDETFKSSYSFPSIQATCSLSVALTVLKYGPNMGLLLTVLAISICIARFLSGQHYISDIIASVGISLLVNLL